MTSKQSCDDLLPTTIEKFVNKILAQGALNATDVIQIEQLQRELSMTKKEFGSTIWFADEKTAIMFKTIADD